MYRADESIALFVWDADCVRAQEESVSDNEAAEVLALIGHMPAEVCRKKGTVLPLCRVCWPCTAGQSEAVVCPGRECYSALLGGNLQLNFPFTGEVLSSDSSICRQVLLELIIVDESNENILSYEVMYDMLRRPKVPPRRWF